TQPRGGVVFDGGPGADVFEGFGAVSYASRTRPVHVDLRRHGAVQGAKGEHDTIERARIVYGGRAADTLIGGPHADVLDGGLCAAKATVAASVEFFDDYKVSDAVFTVSAVGDADDDTMQSTITRGEYGEPLAVFVDDTVGAIAAAGCEQVDATRVRCDAFTPGP